MLEYAMLFGAGLALFLLAIRFYLAWTDSRKSRLLIAWICLAIASATALGVAYMEERALGIHAND